MSSAAVVIGILRVKASMIWSRWFLFIYFSILDQQQKQAIPFQGGVVLSDFDGRIFVASTKEIYSLVPVAWEKQVSWCILCSNVLQLHKITYLYTYLTLLHSEWSKLHRVLTILSAIELRKYIWWTMILWWHLHVWKPVNVQFSFVRVGPGPVDWVYAFHAVRPLVWLSLMKHVQC